MKYVLPAQTDAMIGIRGEYVYIDDFEAAAVGEIVLMRSLTVTGASAAADMDVWYDNSGWWPEMYINCDANGNYQLSYDIELKNSGEVAFNPGDENYTITLIDQEKGEPIAEPLPINIALAPGESGTFNVKLDLSTSVVGEVFYMQIQENITGTIKGNYDYTIQAKQNPATAISTATLRQAEGNAYDLQGRMANGRIVIKAGKKYINK